MNALMISNKVLFLSTFSKGNVQYEEYNKQLKNGSI